MLFVSFALVRPFLYFLYSFDFEISFVLLLLAVLTFVGVLGSRTKQDGNECDKLVSCLIRCANATTLACHFLQSTKKQHNQRIAKYA